MGIRPSGARPAFLAEYRAVRVEPWRVVFSDERPPLQLPGGADLHGVCGEAEEQCRVDPDAAALCTMELTLDGAAVSVHIWGSAPSPPAAEGASLHAGPGTARVLGVMCNGREPQSAFIPAAAACAVRSSADLPDDVLVVPFDALAPHSTFRIGAVAGGVPIICAGVKLRQDMPQLLHVKFHLEGVFDGPPGLELIVFRWLVLASVASTVLAVLFFHIGNTLVPYNSLARQITERTCQAKDGVHVRMAYISQLVATQVVAALLVLLLAAYQYSVWDKLVSGQAAAATTHGFFALTVICASASIAVAVWAYQQSTRGAATVGADPTHAVLLSCLRTQVRHTHTHTLYCRHNEEEE